MLLTKTIHIQFHCDINPIREAAKKTIKRVGGGKGPANKEKITFFGTFFKLLLPFKNSNHFTLDNLSKYGNITLKFVVLSGLLQYFTKK